MPPMTRPRCLASLLMSLALLAGCSAPSLPYAVAAPEVDTIGDTPVLTPAPPLKASTPSPPAPLIPFAFPPGPHARLYLFDGAALDVFAYPQLGRGIENVTALGPERVSFDRAGGIYVYDHDRAELTQQVATESVAAYTFAPSFDDAGTLYFLASNEATRAARGVGVAFYQPPGPSQAPIELGPINELGRRHGGICSLQVTANGETAVFSTSDGGIYLYLRPARRVIALDPDRRYPGADAAIAPTGRWVVWRSLTSPRVYVFDRWNSQLAPIANLEAYPVVGQPPRFYNHDPFHLYLMANVPELGAPRMVSYDLRTTWVRGLVVLNLMAGM